MLVSLRKNGLDSFPDNPYPLIMKGVEVHPLNYKGLDCPKPLVL